MKNGWTEKVEQLEARVKELEGENKSLKNLILLLEEILRLRGYENCWKYLKEVAKEFNFFPIMDRLEKTYLHKWEVNNGK